MSAPNFLDNFIVSLKKHLSCGSVFALFLFLFIYIALMLWSPVIAFILFLIGATILFTVRVEWGIYLLVLTAFFQWWEIDFSGFAWSKDVLFLSSLNAPLIDFVGVIVFVSAVLALMLHLRSIRGKKIQEIFPGILPYGLFLLIAAASFFLVSVGTLVNSIPTIIRPLVSVYLLFILLPYHTIQTKHVFERVVQLLFFVGVLISLYGLSSLFVDNPLGWTRVFPYPMGRFAPLGTNHNLLAEPLVALIPLGFWLFAKAKSAERIVQSNVYLIGTIFFILIALLTLSRAAWVSLLIQALVFAWVRRKELRDMLPLVSINIFLPVCIIFIAIGSYMAIFLQSSTIASSTFSRIETTKIAFSIFLDKPFIGHGPGTFIPVFEEIAIYTREFGEPLDAHGFIQKILVEEGLLGFICFGWFLFFVLREAYRKGQLNKHAQAFFITVLGVIVFQLFNTSYFGGVMWLPMGLALAFKEKWL